MEVTGKFPTSKEENDMEIAGNTPVWLPTTSTVFSRETVQKLSILRKAINIYLCNEMLYLGKKLTVTVLRGLFVPKKPFSHKSLIPTKFYIYFNGVLCCSKKA